MQKRERVQGSHEENFLKNNGVLKSIKNSEVVSNTKTKNYSDLAIRKSLVSFAKVVTVTQWWVETEPDCGGLRNNWMWISICHFIKLVHTRKKDIGLYMGNAARKGNERMYVTLRLLSKSAVIAFFKTSSPWLIHFKTSSLLFWCTIPQYNNQCLFPNILLCQILKKLKNGTSLVVQRVRVCLPVQGRRVWSLVHKDSTWQWAAKPVCYNYRARVPQLLKPAHPRACSQQEKPPQWEAHALQWKLCPDHHNQRKSLKSNKDAAQRKINKEIQNKTNQKITLKQT